MEIIDSDTARERLEKAIENAVVVAVEATGIVDDLRRQLDRHDSNGFYLSAHDYVERPSLEILTRNVPVQVTPIESAVISFKLQSNSPERVIAVSIGSKPSYQSSGKTRYLEGQWVETPTPVTALYRLGTEIVIDGQWVETPTPVTALYRLGTEIIIVWDDKAWPTVNQFPEAKEVSNER